MNKYIRMKHQNKGFKILTILWREDQKYKKKSNPNPSKRPQLTLLVLKPILEMWCSLGSARNKKNKTRKTWLIFLVWNLLIAKNRYFQFPFCVFISHPVTKASSGEKREGKSRVFFSFSWAASRTVGVPCDCIQTSPFDLLSLNYLWVLLGYL